MGRRGPDEGVDVVDGRLGHRAAKPNDRSRRADARGPTTVEVMLLTTIAPLVAQPHGQPLHPHARLPAARLRDRALRARGRCVFIAITLVARAVAPRSRGATSVLVAGRGARSSSLNQIGFVYALERSSALRDRADPRRDADLRRARSALALRHGDAAAALLGAAPCSRSRASRSSPSAPASRGLRRRSAGVLLGVLTAATWAGVLDR